MADIKVRDLTDTQTINTDNEIMVLTNDAQNQVQNITVENFITNVISSDSDNVLEQGTDGKLYVETPVNITGNLADLDTVNKTSLVNSINEVVSNLSNEATTRANADNNLQSQIDAITAASDVTDIVGTYAELQAYDTTGLPDNSIIKVLQDESRQDETTYYRWVITGGVGAWVLIGEEGPYYTISQADSKFATQETVGNLNNLATSDKSSVVNAMNELASVLDPTQTADYIKNSKAIYSGEVSENALILPQIKEMAHSTFDRSKFTVLGSPNITNDGIASGFSGSNYLTTSTISLSNNNNFEIEAEFTTDSTVGFTSTSQFMFGNGWNLYFGIEANNSRFIFAIKGNGAKINTTNSTILQANTTYKVKCWYKKTGQMGYTLTFSDGTSETFYKEVNETFNYSSSFYIGINTLADLYRWQGSTNLKQFSITVDGVEVFSGNKTGIDTIKPDDYTVVGTPTISADGIASGFSGSNYLKPTFDFNTLATKDNWEFDVCITTNNLTSLETYNYIYATSGASFSSFNINSSKKLVCFMRGTEIIELIGDAVLQANTTYYVKFIKNGTLYQILLSTDGVNYTVDKQQTSNAIFNAQGTWTIGVSTESGFERPFTGSIDLNAFKIYVDGTLVYQPCLKIPYTLSKTGSKIVQSVYRDRVNDMAEQFGYAPYYTLSDNDFTLPQGEIYGYLEKRARDIAHPVAQPFYRFSDEINEDEVRLEGAEVDKGLYLAIEQDPYLSALCTAGSTDDKICLPDFRNRVIYGDIASGYVEPELPNITGSVKGPSGTSADGAFTVSSSVPLGAGSSSSIREGRLSFNASLSSSIYKDGGTVKTAGVKARWLCRWK